MKREEFIAQMTQAERQIRRRVVPLGVVYAVRLASAFACLVLAVLLFLPRVKDARITLLFELGVCVLLFLASFAAERDAKRRFVRLAAKCSKCQTSLVFLEMDVEGRKTLETGCCYKCGGPVFDR
jgi:hypothetical protein